MTYELVFDYFQGPLDKLLELIEGEKLEVTQLGLASVTEGFLQYIGELRKKVSDTTQVNFEEGGDTGLIADFLVVASQLLLLKSKALLPSLQLTEEEESEIKDLESRLKLYQELKGTKLYIKNGWHELPTMLGREFLMATEPLFYPPSDVGGEELHQAFMKVCGEWEKIFRPVKTVRTEIIHIGQKIKEILARLTDASVGFNELRTSRTKKELVVLFLAILHLIKQQLVQVEQASQFEEIMVVKKVLSA